MCYTNLVPRAFFSTAQKQGGAMALGNVTGLKFQSRSRSQSRTRSLI